MLPGLNPAVSERKPYSWKIAGEGRKCGCESVDEGGCQCKWEGRKEGKGMKRKKI